MINREYQNRMVRKVLDGSSDTGLALYGGRIKTGDYEAAKQLKEYYVFLLANRSFYSVLNVVRRHRSAKRRAEDMAVAESKTVVGV